MKYVQCKKIYVIDISQNKGCIDTTRENHNLSMINLIMNNVNTLKHATKHLLK